MTVPNGPILFNSSTGSDTAASGLGPATALFGTGASLNTTSTVTLSADTPDLSGVVAGDLLWVDTSSGRQFSIIASVDDGADTVTCDDAFTVTESGRNWGIGGKRATVGNINSRKLFETADAKAGWEIELGDGHTETLSTSLTIAFIGNSTDGLIEFRGEEGATTQPVLMFSNNGNAIILSAASGVGVFRLDNFELQNSNATKTASVGINFLGGGNTKNYITISRIKIIDATNKFWKGITLSSSGGSMFLRNEIQNCTSHGMQLNNGAFLFANVCSNNAGSGVDVPGVPNNNAYRFNSNIFANNGICGIDFNQQAGEFCSIVNNILYNNISHGIDVGNSGSTLICIGNIYSLNGGYGKNTTSFGAGRTMHEAYYNNTSGQYNFAGYFNDSDIILTVNPFVNATNGDFNLNNTVGGGAELRDVSIAINTDTTSYPFRGLVSASFGTDTLFNIIGAS